MVNTWLFPIMIGHLGATWTYLTFGVINVVILCHLSCPRPGISLEQFEHSRGAYGVVSPAKEPRPYGRAGL